ncbi:hypothetical protein BC629DRAFT_291477 [Irpex lacteus]|nr:hypothetical protein BC629DRAFT_291477 [Irpex lacteus]
MAVSSSCNFQKTQKTLLLASDDFLHEFASDIHTAFPDSPTKCSLISSLLTTAIAKAPLTLTKPYVPASTVHHTRIPAVDRRLSRAKMYVQLVHELGCGRLVGDIIDRVVDTDVLPVVQRENYARLVILPLVVLIAHEYRTVLHGDDIKTRFGNLQRKGMELFLSFLCDERNHVDVMQREITVFFDAALANNDGLLFTEMVYPQLETSPLSPTLLQFFVEELARRKDQFAVLSDRSQSPTASVTVESMSRALTMHFLERVDFKDRVNIIRALDLCATGGALDLCDDVITKCLSATVATPQYIEDVLIPLLPELRTWADGHDRNMDASIQAIVVAWLDRVLGTRPVPDSAVATQLTSLPAWSCSCHACVAARTFLIKGEDDTKTLDRIGIKH